ncbi:hypothetical protein LA345_36535 (plasmid) [Burkholderia vietnamiensis]|uniref:Uncharacterized protein n=1 Tax=Burkholderia vietnamiensis (strain G4 / LMG 22486) TaxID=269482 RepID=A4JVT0_BURVG|nr:hypothetical protein Bcep1808_7508 [Burkholderia vietnamiensis G4]MCB4349320.1 hypothetical protein [Burkholderia vietnamiensis]
MKTPHVTDPLIGTDAWTTSISVQGKTAVYPCSITAVGDWKFDRAGTPWRALTVFVPGFNAGSNIVVSADTVFVDEECTRSVDVGAAPAPRTSSAIAAPCDEHDVGAGNLPFAIGQKFAFEPGQRVICNGYPGAVRGMYTEGMVEVRLDAGLVCVPASYPDCYPSDGLNPATPSSRDRLESPAPAPDM